MKANPQDRIHRKNLGQFFTPPHVAQLLARNAEAKDAHRIVDPMAGDGNLLAACLNEGADPEYMCGVEIDPPVANAAMERFSDYPNVDFFCGNSFQHAWESDSFDLVITNPPFVRYRGESLAGRLKLPTADQIRRDLINKITQLKSEKPSDLDHWLDTATKYPKNADLAVPSLILCSALVAPGGTLAMIAPTTWMQRSYASGLRSLIQSAFTVERVIEDGDASWFQGAQVRTQIVICRRTTGLSDMPPSPTKYARLTRDFWSSKNDLQSPRWHPATGSFPGGQLPLAFAPGDVSGTNNLTSTVVGSDFSIRSLLTHSKSLKDFGWNVGQGLRTGANDFFYVNTSAGKVQPNAVWGIDSIDVPAECLKPAIRNQTQLVLAEDSNPKDMKPAILDLNGWVTESDYDSSLEDRFRVLPPLTSSWIESVSKAKKRTPSGWKLYPELSAVAPNAKKDRSGKPLQMWYHLPAFTSRHNGPIFMPRVIGARPTAIANSSTSLIDANFSTFWPNGPTAVSVTAMLAILNSSWTWYALETCCHVLGGGALKVEAKNLRELPFPEFSAEQIRELSFQGSRLMDGFDPTNEIDQLFDDAIGRLSSNTPTRIVSDSLHALSMQKTNNRINSI